MYFSNIAGDWFGTLFIACSCMVVLWFAVKLQEYLAGWLNLNKSYKKIRGPKPHWLLGNLDDITPDQKGMLKGVEYMNERPKLQVLQYGPFYRSLSCHFPTVLQTALAVDQPKDKAATKFLIPWIGEGLLLSHGKKWKRNRKLLTSAFHFEILKNYVSVFNESAETMIEKFLASTGRLEVFAPVSLMTLDGMLQCLMSLKSDCQNLGMSHPYVKAVHDLSELFTKRFFNIPWSNNDFVYSLTADGRKHKAAIDVTRRQTTLVMQNRRKELNERGNVSTPGRKLDFLDILLLAKDGKGNNLTENEIRSEVDTFLFEGHDTTASGISWIIYDLATHLDYQEKCRNEVKEVLENWEYVEYSDLNKMTYLTMFIKESMRIHPPVPFIGRTLNDPIKFDKDFGDDQDINPQTKPVNPSQELPINTSMEINIFNLHRNKNVWEEPEKFDPLRFTAENISKRHAYAHLPFSAGPRNCIGQNFAMMEIKISLAKCLMKVKFSVSEDCEKPLMMARLVLRSENGIHVIVEEL